ncbi:MAG: recombinase family protein [Nitrosomonas ureae]
MNNQDTQKAVIYCRVSSAAQMQKGDGINSQLTRCMEFSKHKGYEVCEVFKDEATKGSVIERPGMQAMLRYLKKHKNEHMVVLIDDISRLARDISTHIQLRTAISAASGKLESPSIEFGEDSDSLLVENLLASVSQHQRQKNAEQTLNRMKARTMNGYWVFNAPLGYRYCRVSGHAGQMLVRDEPLASIVTEALEGFANGRFETQSEVKRFLDASAHYPKDNSGEVRFQRVTDLLNKVVYSGYIEVPTWNISLRKAQHEPLISFETFQKIQNRLHSKPKVPVRADISDDFPLRGFIICGCCGHPMTACWSKGRNASYPYYMCFKKGCVDYRKSIAKHTIEGEFEQLLFQLTPSENLISMVKAMFKVLWDDRASRRTQNSVAFENEIKKISLNIDKLLNRILESENQTLVSTYEKKLKSLEYEKAALNEKIARCGSALPDYDKTFRTALDFLQNPYKLWDSQDLIHKRTVLKLVFAERLPYIRNEGFRTAQLSLPFKFLKDIEGCKMQVAEREAA